MLCSVRQARDRQLYHLRHTRDYEALGIPIGASKADAKAAYRQLAKVGFCGDSGAQYHVPALHMAVIALQCPVSLDRMQHMPISCWQYV